MLAIKDVSVAWWGYFWLLVVLAGVDAWLIKDWSSGLDWGSGAIGLVGLWGYLRRRPVGWRWLWVLYLVLLVLHVVHAAYRCFLMPTPGRAVLAVAVVVGMALVTPLFVALWRYVFTEALWREERMHA